MINITIKTECCGCEACASVCPKQCINMKADDEGFLYPEVDASLCVNCGMCEKICPIQNQSERTAVQHAYVMQHRDKELRVASSSGGAFSALANYVIGHGGTVYGVVFDDCMNVVHSRATNQEELALMRGSKYVQSKIDDVYVQAKNDLKKENTVLFTGTPCQIEGLLNYLGKDYSNLITADLVCHGVSSPKVWGKYLSDTENKYSSKIVEYSFRSKKTGFHDFGTEIVFANGTKRYTHDKGEDKDFMHLAYFNEICSRPSCHDCKFKTAARRSDFTLFDCWHVAAFDKSVEDDLGTSSILLHTKKAMDLFENIKDKIWCKEVDARQLIELDGNNVEYSMKPNARRKEFFEELDGKSCDELQEIFFKSKRKSPIVIAVKWILRKVGIFEVVKRSVYQLTRGSYKERL